jgi:hypothetical protein
VVHLTTVHERVNRSSLRGRLESRSSTESAKQGVIHFDGVPAGDSDARMIDVGGHSV